MRKPFCIMAIFIILPIIITPLVVCTTSDSSTLTVPYTQNSPIVDGKWTTPSEWSDASENILSNNNGWTAYVRTKHNSTDLFILVDFVSDQTGDSLDSIATYDYCGFFFDTANDKGNYPKTDDYLFSHYYSSLYATSGLQIYVSQGTGLNSEGSNWAEISTPQGFDLERGTYSTNDPYESTIRHRIYEASIPKRLLGSNSTVGFYMFVRDANSGSALIGSILQFPDNAGGASTRSDAKADLIAPAPKNWGELTFLNYSLPSPTTTIPSDKPTATPNQILSMSDLTIIALIAVIAIVIAILVLTGRKKPKIKAN